MKKRRLDLKWIISSSSVMTYDEFMNSREILDSCPEMKNFNKVRTKGGYTSPLTDNLQSNLDKYSIIENGEFPSKNKKKIWTLFTKKIGETAYRLSDDFEFQLNRLRETSSIDYDHSRDELKEYSRKKSNLINEKLSISERKMLFISEKKKLYVKRRDNSFVRLAKEMFFEKTDGCCMSCGYSFIREYGVEYIEMHHKVLFSAAEENIREYNGFEEVLNDFEFLCSNCHSAIHLK